MITPPDIALIGGTILTEDPLQPIIKDGCILIHNKKIVAIGKKDDIDYTGYGIEKIFLSPDHLVLPGLINTHTHMAMTLLRGYSDDKDLYTWLEKDIFPAEAVLTPEDIYIGAKLGAVESVLNGVTTVNTMYHSAGYEAKALSDIGLRGVVGHVCFSWRKDADLKATKHLIETSHNTADGLIRVSLDPHAPYTADPELLTALRDIGEESNNRFESMGKPPIIWHIHIAETNDEIQKTQTFLGQFLDKAVINKYFANNSFFDYLDKLGVYQTSIDIPMLAAHCVALKELDFKILRKHNIGIATNPVSNLKLASGIAPVPHLLEQNFHVGIGTDSASSNNSLDILESMKILGLIYKGVLHDPTIMKSNQVVQMATTGGALALNYKDVGVLKNGNFADIIIINMNKPHLKPIYDFYSHLVYATKSSDVETVIINGKIIVKERKILTTDMQDLLNKVQKTKDQILDRILQIKQS